MAVFDSPEFKAAVRAIVLDDDVVMAFAKKLKTAMSELDEPKTYHSSELEIRFDTDGNQNNDFLVITENLYDTQPRIGLFDPNTDKTVEVDQEMAHRIVAEMRKQNMESGVQYWAYFTPKEQSDHD